MLNIIKYVFILLNIIKYHLYRCFWLRFFSDTIYLIQRLVRQSVYSITCAAHVWFRNLVEDYLPSNILRRRLSFWQNEFLERWINTFIHLFEELAIRKDILWIFLRIYPKNIKFLIKWKYFFELNANRKLAGEKKISRKYHEFTSTK